MGSKRDKWYFPPEPVLSVSDRFAYDVYWKVSDHAHRMAVRPGASLPDHVSAAEWEILPMGWSQVIDGAEEDIVARGFCYFRLV